MEAVEPAVGETGDSFGTGPEPRSSDFSVTESGFEAMPIVVDLRPINALAAGPSLSKGQVTVGGFPVAGHPDKVKRGQAPLKWSQKRAKGTAKLWANRA